jgi:diaminopimelate epimerase
MIKIPFTKAHGAHNDFLLSWDYDVPTSGLSEIAIAICDRHTGIGADGWMLMSPGEGDHHVSITLYNSDGSRSEISGNGTRCVAALMVRLGVAADEVRVRTGAGLKHLRILNADDPLYTLEMNMGAPDYANVVTRQPLEVESAAFDASILNVGNPQCAVFVRDFDFDWRRVGAMIERHSLFPNRTNVSFVRPLDRHAVDVRFWERGAGETMSSGTGSTGAAFAALLRELVDSPVRVSTPAGDLDFRVEDGVGFLIGPAQIVGAGEFYTRH